MSSLWKPAAGGAWEPARVPVTDTIDQALSLGPGVRLIRQGTGSESLAALLVGEGKAVHVNGQAVLGGLRVLEHRDEILVGADRFYYSAESAPVRAVFRLDEGDRRPVCPVCRGPLRDGELAVACPGCGRWHHQADPVEGQRTRACWTYAAECRFCRHPTSMSGEPTWSPDKEEARD